MWAHFSSSSIVFRVHFFFASLKFRFDEAAMYVTHMDVCLFDWYMYIFERNEVSENGYRKKKPNNIS